MPTASETFASWALGLRLDDVPVDAQRAACRHLLDGLGCAIAAVRAGETHPALDVARSLGGPAEATVLGTREQLSAPAAALANGVAVHALDYDDTHTGALVHATAAVLPAAFAVAEQTGATGEELLVAAIAGYETVTRLGAAVPHGFHARGFHATSVCGVFAAALVSAKLMGLDEQRAVHALGIAGSLASGSLAFLRDGSSTKQLHPGLAGMNGIIAARLAAAGASGPAGILEGEYGLFRSFTDTALRADDIVAGLGSVWEVERITIKPYAACQLSHASLDALRAVLPKLPVPEAIQTITFDVPEGAVPIVCEPAMDKQRPRTPYEAKFSLPWCAALLVVDGALSFSSESLGREDLVAMAARVAYRIRRYDGPPADAPGYVEVRALDGTPTFERWDVPHSRGGPDAPLSEDELLAKFTANGGTDQLARMILSLPEQRDLGPILERAR